MKVINTIAGIILLGAVSGGCTLFKKQIVKPVVVCISDTLFMASLNPATVYPKYLNYAGTATCAQSFLKGFKSEARNTKNITLKYNESEADFIVKVKSLVVTESSRLQKVSDPKSPYNGMDLELNSIECVATLEITDTRNKTKTLNNCTNTKTRSEQITNNRNLDDLINGRNKNNTQYRTKLLDDNICLHLSEDVGRRIWVPITRRIAGDIK